MKNISNNKFFELTSAADTEARGAGSLRSSSLGQALRLGVAGSHVSGGGGTGSILKLDNLEDAEN